MLASSPFHKEPSEALVLRLGLVYNACGVYFLLRCLTQNLEDLLNLCRLTALLLIPVAVAMLIEKHTLHNVFSAMEGLSISPEIREGKVRAQGPFLHAILAGTVGGVCFPMTVALWKQDRVFAVIGAVACVAMSTPARRAVRS